MNDMQKGLSFLFLPLVTGCVAMAFAAGNLEAENSKAPLVYVTLHHTFDRVDDAARQALKTLDARIEREDSIRSGKKILAAAANEKIILVLEPLATHTTRLSIHTPVKGSHIPKETFLEILRQTQYHLQG